MVIGEKIPIAVKKDDMLQVVGLVKNGTKEEEIVIKKFSLMREQGSIGI